MRYEDVQKIAKNTMEYARTHIKAGMNLIDIRKICEDKMLELGADSFWYWNIGAFIFSGNETTISISGREYQTSNRIIKDCDIITIDLSPQYGDIWGDYARTLILQNGVVVDNCEIQNHEWHQGLQMEDLLHRELLYYATPDTTFEDLFYHMNDYIQKYGFINLDFSGNLGHSIVRKKSDRVYIEKGNILHLSDVDFFTFEPHISIKGSQYGYKKENIYYFSNDKLTEL